MDIIIIGIVAGAGCCYQFSSKEAQGIRNEPKNKNLQHMK